MMKKQKMPTDINALISETPDVVFKNKEKHLPWFATTIAVIVTTILCAAFDGSNIYLTLSTQTRDNVLLTVILAIGTTFLMNFSGTVLGDMFKSYVQKVGNIKKWMIGTFLIVISLLFVGVFIFRYGNADGPFVSTVVKATLSGGSTSVQKEEVSAIIKYSLATIINISSVVSSFLCFIIGYYNSDPKKKKEQADLKILFELTQHRAALNGIKEELDSITADALNEFESERFDVVKDIADFKSVLRKERFREQLNENVAKDSVEVGDVVDSSKRVLLSIRNNENINQRSY